MSEGTANLSWAPETFGYAEAHDGTTWLGVRTGEHVVAGGPGLLLRPDVVPLPSAAVVSPELADASTALSGSGGISAAITGATTVGSKDVAEFTRFYARFDLDNVRGV